MLMKMGGHTKKWPTFLASNTGQRTTSFAASACFQNTGVVAGTRGGRNHQLVDEEMEDEAVTIVEQHAEFTLAQINHELRLRLPDKPHDLKYAICCTDASSH